jgi:hypothetical protein
VFGCSVAVDGEFIAAVFLREFLAVISSFAPVIVALKCEKVAQKVDPGHGARKLSAISFKIKSAAVMPFRGRNFTYSFTVTISLCKAIVLNESPKRNRT